MKTRKRNIAIGSGLLSLAGKTLLITAVFALAGVCTVEAGPIDFDVTYTFDDMTSGSKTFTDNEYQDPTPVPTAEGVTFGSFTKVGWSYNTDNLADDLIAFRHSGLQETPQDAMDVPEYYYQTVTPDAGKEMTLDKFTWNMASVFSGGPEKVVVRSDLDNYQNNLATASAPGGEGNISVLAGNVYDLSGVSDRDWSQQVSLDLGTDFQGLEEAVTFRMVFYDAQGYNKQAGVDNFNIQGSTIPEPTTGVLFVAVSGLMWFVRRKLRA